MNAVPRSSQNNTEFIAFLPFSQHSPTSYHMTVRKTLRVTSIRPGIRNVFRHVFVTPHRYTTNMVRNKEAEYTLSL